MEAAVGTPLTAEERVRGPHTVRVAPERIPLSYLFCGQCGFPLLGPPAHCGFEPGPGASANAGATPTTSAAVARSATTSRLPLLIPFSPLPPTACRTPEKRAPPDECDPWGISRFPAKYNAPSSHGGHGRHDPRLLLTSNARLRRTVAVTVGVRAPLRTPAPVARGSARRAPPSRTRARRPRA
jgi:hypothetical protein